MSTLKNIGVLSTAKITALVALAIGIIYAVIAIGLINFAPSMVALILSRSTHPGILASMLSNITLGLDILLLIGIPIVLFVLEFIFVAVGTYLYNKIVPKIGGIKGTFKNGEIKNLDALSVGKMAGVLGGMVVLITIIISSLVAAFTTGAGALLLLLVGLVEVVIIGVVYFVCGVIAVWIYNFLAVRIGGIELTVKKKEITKIAILPYAKIEAIFSAILGFIYGAVVSVVFLLISLVPRGTSISMGHPLIRILGPYSIILFPIAFFIIGFVAAAIGAGLYNWLVPKVGGIKVNAT
jgi:hypothetical protein